MGLYRIGCRWKGLDLIFILKHRICQPLTAVISNLNCVGCAKLVRKQELLPNKHFNYTRPLIAMGSLTCLGYNSPRIFSF